MNGTIQARYEARAKILKALAHPTRLFLLDQLASGPRPVAHLTRQVAADISTVSKHLSILKNAGLVASTRTGMEVHYRLCVPCVMNFFGCIENVLRANAREQMRVVATGRKTGRP